MPTPTWTTDLVSPTGQQLTVVSVPLDATAGSTTPARTYLEAVELRSVNRFYKIAGARSPRWLNSNAVRRQLQEFAPTVPPAAQLTSSFEIREALATILTLEQVEERDRLIAFDLVSDLDRYPSIVTSASDAQVKPLTPIAGGAILIGGFTALGPIAVLLAPLGMLVMQLTLDPLLPHLRDRLRKRLDRETH